MLFSKNVFIFLFTALVLTASAQSNYIKKSETIESRNGHNYYIHQVEKGQTVYSIAKAYDVTVDEIFFENPSAKTGISIGQELLIPTINKETQLNTEVKSTNFEFFYHIAAANETFEHIASIYVIPEEYIRKANPNLHGNLREGEYVKVPVEGSFNALNGNTIVDQANSIPDTYTPTPTTRKPQPKPPVTKPTVTTETPRQNTTPATSNPIPTPTAKPPVKPSQTNTEFVSFDPNIPVIADYRHVVIAGETTQSIADKYDVPVNLLKACNPGLGNSVVKGDRLRVPDKTKLKAPETAGEQPATADIAPVQPPADTKPQSTEPAKPQQNQESEFIQHVVKKKETLYSIGREYGVTVKEILDANPGLTTNIKIGQVIKVPKKKLTHDYLEYKSTSKTKTKQLAKLYQIDAEDITDLNPALGKWVYPGQVVRIPVGAYALDMANQPVEPEIVPTKITPEEINEIPNVFDLCDKNQPNRQRVFHVALMLPLYLDQLDSLNKTEFLQQNQSGFKPFRFIGFYEGALLALDSLRQQGMQIDMRVYDVDQSLTSATKVLQEPELRSMDLIIGPLFPQCYHQVALFAGNFNIPIVNPLTFREEAAFSYKTAIKVKPGNEFQNDRLISYINRYYPRAKVFLITQSAYEDADQVQNLLNSLRSNVSNQTKISNTDLYNLAIGVAQRDEDYTSGTPLPTFRFEGQNIYPDMLEQTLADSTTFQNGVSRIVYMIDSLHPFLENASTLRPNVVVLYGNKKSFVMDVMNRLNESRDTFNIKLVGMPTWERINELSNTQLSNLNTAYFSSDFMDFEAPPIKRYMQDFRQVYGLEPDPYAYLGFDITYYFLYNLFLFDDHFFQCLESNPMPMMQTTYEFKRKSENSFENSYWNLLRYRGLNLYKVPDAALIPENTTYE